MCYYYYSSRNVICVWMDINYFRDVMTLIMATLTRCSALPLHASAITTDHNTLTTTQRYTAQVWQGFIFQSFTSFLTSTKCIGATNLRLITKTTLRKFFLKSKNKRKIQVFRDAGSTERAWRQLLWPCSNTAIVREA